MTRLADLILCPPLVRTGKTLHLPECPSIQGRQTWACKWAEGRTLGQVADSLGPGKVKPCLRCDPLFLPGVSSSSPNNP